MTKTQESVKHMMAEEFGLLEISNQEPIFSAKLLDSMDVLKLIMLLEGEFSIKIPTFEVSLEMFDSIDSIADLVDSRK